MKKFINCEIISVLDEIMRNHTENYQSDFEIDRKIIKEAALSKEKNDRRLLWLSRPNGTVCVRECDVYLKDTYAHNAWKFYGEQTHDSIKAYYIEVRGELNDSVRGNVYELDYPSHCKHVTLSAVPIGNVKQTYRDGTQKIVPYGMDGADDICNPHIRHIEYLPQNLEMWQSTLEFVHNLGFSERYILWTLEKLKLENGQAATYRVYQMKNEQDEMLFCSFDKFKAHGRKVNIDDFELTYIGKDNVKISLNGMFDLFNISRPDDFYGHSVSVSDVLVVNDCGKPCAYFVDRYDFKKVPDFFDTGKAKSKSDIQM